MEQLRQVTNLHHAIHAVPFPDSRTLRNHRVRWAMFTRPDSQPHHRDAGLASAGPLSSRHIAVAALIEGFAGIARIHSVAGCTGGRSIFRGCLGSGQRNLSRIVSSSLPSRENVDMPLMSGPTTATKKRMACHVISAEAMRFSKQSATIIRFEILRKYAPRVATR